MTTISKKMQNWAIEVLDLGFDRFKAGDPSPFILLLDVSGKQDFILLKSLGGGGGSRLMEVGREIIRDLNSGGSTGWCGTGI